MNKEIAATLTVWIRYRPWRKVCRDFLLQFDPIANYERRRRIKRYLRNKASRGKAKIVIYTAIAGNCDRLKSHTFLSGEIDYVCYTDTPVQGLHAWEIRPMTEFDHKEPVRKAKYYKLFPDRLFPEYEYSVWIDGAWDVVADDLEDKLEMLMAKGSSLGLLPHPSRCCIYDEAIECIRSQKDNPEIIVEQIAYLKSEGYPSGAGLFDMSIIFRRHHEPAVKKVMDDWWQVITRFSYRDQLSFNYVLWLNKLDVDQIFPLNDTPRRGNKSFVLYKHVKPQAQLNA